MRTIRIIADGPTSRNAKVVDAETGEPVEGVAAAEISMGVGQINRAVLTIVGVEVDVVAQVETRRDRLRAVLAAHGRVAIDDLDQVLDDIEDVISGRSA